MEAINKERVASVVLVQAKVSEDELAVYEAALSYVLDSLDESEIARRFGASIDEIEGMRDDLREIITLHGETAHKPEPIVK
ncbi:MAG: hypothetical protein AUG51_21800 [Acidobacteria bacterium 13_1_20CM_3_53_8]|nr:MAG: hypothetical protein AUG51_21800 [Acidobacteria bacterium 13_1_20CM_3_53_8]